MTDTELDQLLEAWAALQRERLTPEERQHRTEDALAVLRDAATLSARSASFGKNTM